MRFQQKFSERASFKTLLYYEDYWFGLLKSPEYEKIALEDLQQLVLMPTTYVSEKGFSCLVEMKTKKRNALAGVVFLMRETLKESINQQSEKLTTKVQEHPSH